MKYLEIPTNPTEVEYRIILGEMLQASHTFVDTARAV